MKYDYLLLDGLNVMHRAGFSYQLGYWEDSNYHETGAVYGFFRIAMTFYNKYAAPGAKLIVCWDAGYKHRLELYPNYKISRRVPVAPEDSEKIEQKAQHRGQKQALHAALGAAGWRSSTAYGYEADDVLATLSTRFSALGKTVAMCTTDQDLHQVVSNRVHVISKGPKGEKVWDPKAVEAKWGFPPDRVAELKALMGDSGDDIPGCPGCGLGSARKLLQSYGSIEGVLEASPKGPLTGVWEGKPWKAKALSTKMVENAELVRISHELAKVVCDVEADVVHPEASEESLRAQFSLMTFYTLLEERNLNRILEIGGKPALEMPQEWWLT
jgi:DNA polymerase I